MTNTDITIPTEAVEAAAIVLHANAEIFFDTPWGDLGKDDQDAYRKEAEAALRAGLRAWPGMEIEMVGEADDLLILPLPPKENTNAET